MTSHLPKRAAREFPYKDQLKYHTFHSEECIPFCDYVLCVYSLFMLCNDKVKMIPFYKEKIKTDCWVHGGSLALLMRPAAVMKKNPLLVAPCFDPDGLNMVIPQQHEDIFTTDRLRSRINTAEEKWPRIMEGRKSSFAMRSHLSLLKDFTLDEKLKLWRTES